MRQPGEARGALAGAQAGAVLVWGLVAGWGTGGLPVVAGALWERAVRLLPMEVFGFLIVRFKFAAKPLGFWALMLAVVVGAAAAGGLWARRPRGPVPSLAVAFVVVAAALGLAAWQPAVTLLSARLAAEGVLAPEAAAARAVAATVVALAALTAAVFTALLTVLLRRPAAASLHLPPGAAAVSRRHFLARSVALAAALTGAAAAAQWVTARAAHAAAAVSSLFRRLKGLPPEVTPTDRFYVVSKNPPGLDPRLDASRWRLEITGLVAKPVVLTYEQIKALPAVERYHTLECISNEVGGELIGNARWKGVRFRDLIALAGGVSPKAVRFALRCADGYSEGLGVADALHPDTMLAYEMNGEPLPPAHGFPVRLLVPGLFGMKNPKWVTKIEAVSTHFTGYWQASGWSDEAVVKTTSMFRVPAGRTAARAPDGAVELGGVAYAGDRGIVHVEVSADDGKTWMRAEVAPPLGKYTWVLWAALWTPTGPATYTLKVRARDGTGVLQTAQEAPTLPDGASGYHTIRVRVR
ncbi:MAG: molybdopterin-dependent oxidoreductase [Armatimonadota bacterium]|nr:molybdopterin-dependent oxidoreductase [Armatimonadota bacterium]